MCPNFPQKMKPRLQCFSNPYVCISRIALETDWPESRSVHPRKMELPESFGASYLFSKQLSNANTIFLAAGSSVRCSLKPISVSNLVENMDTTAESEGRNSVQNAF
eukprot:GHVN01034525.1.p1 GENE.GHVN01034525.1~~GHVN01034525.1.p1  ORF type:complete len:106 (-),score=4.16 GHVN01034525.1:15-332(-)